MKDLILCGCYRSGTSIASIMLSHHPELLVTDELWYFYRDRRRACFNDRFKRLLEHYPNMGERPFIPTNILGDRYEEFLKLMMKQHPNIDHEFFKEKLREYSGRDAKYFGDKLPEYIFELDNFTQIYNGFKTIMCIRDPRDIICSQLRMYQFHVKQAGHIGSHWWCKKTIEECIDMVRNWLTYMKTWDNAKGRVDGYELKYFNLVKHPKNEATKLADFLGVDREPMISIITEQFKPSRYQEWKTSYPNITEKLPKEWLQMMERYGIKI